jgi:hypothetical protein
MRKNENEGTVPIIVFYEFSETATQYIVPAREN